MGQTTSKQHDPLTFGYINRVNSEDQLVDPIPDCDQQVTDYILTHPHLYKLEITCQNGCNPRLVPSDSKDNSKEPDSVVIATKVNKECEVCRQNKRLSLVRRNLAKDLAYIDETYYPDVIHYMSNDEEYNGDEGPDSILVSPDGSENLDKLTIGEVAPGRSRSARLANASLAVNLSNRSLIKLSPSIGYLDNLTKLDLSHNQMTTLPPTIGYLKNLRMLDTSHNRLESVPDTIAFLSKLTALNVSHNNLEALPSSIGLLPRLIVVIANDNRLTHLPREIAQLRGLVSLNVSNNPLQSLPAEIGNLASLRKLVAEGCEFLDEFRYSVEQQDGPPSLFELCARAAVRHEIPIPGHMPEHIKEYFGRVQTCSFCGGPFFDSFVTRGRFIERSARQVIAFEHRLCSAHWSTEEDRLHAMFAPAPSTAVLPSLGRNPSVNTDGLVDNPQQQQQNNIHIFSPQPRRILGNNRSRAYSDLSTRSNTASPALSLSSSTSSQLSRQSSSSVSLSLYSSSYSPQSELDLVSIKSLKRQPSLPALPAPAVTRTASLKHTSTGNRLSPPPQASRPKLRPRASSSSSVTRRLTGLLSSSPSRSFSNSNLRLQQSWTQTAAAADSDYGRSTRLEDLSEVETERPAGLSGADELTTTTTTTRGSWQAQPSIIFTSDQDTDSAASGTSVSVALPVMRTASPKIPSASGFRASLAHLGSRFATRDRSGTV